MGKGRVLVGFRERAGPYLTDMRHCPVLAPPLDGLLGELADLIAGTSIREKVPQIEAAVADGVTALVLRVLQAPSAVDEQVLREFGVRHNIDIYLQPGGPGTVAPLSPPRTLSYKLEAFGVTLQFLPTDFVQVNAAINAELVATAIDLAAIEPTDRVLDLSAGSAISVCPSRNALASCSAWKGRPGSLRELCVTPRRTVSATPAS